MQPVRSGGALKHISIPPLLLMHLRFAFILVSALLLIVSGCDKSIEVVPTTRTCENERLLETYVAQEGMVIQGGDEYWLTVAPEDLQTGSYRLNNVLVPTQALPTSLKVEGLRVKVSGRKKSCYGLVTLPELRTMFGYKFELDHIEKASK
jgi:hypothetical protein